MTVKEKAGSRDLSKVVVFVGPRGSGKTLSMVVEAVFQMALYNRQVWSNIPISFRFKEDDGTIVEHQSQPLNMDSLYTVDDTISSGFVLIDEINLWADARRSMGVGNRLISHVFQLIRKRQLSFLLTVQNFTWLDNRIRWQSDALVKCRDAKYQRKGERLKFGERISQSWLDMSGVFTGYTNEERPDSDYRRELWGELFWDVYDSWSQFDILESMQSVKLKLGTKVISRDDLTNARDNEFGKKLETVKLAIDTVRGTGQDKIEAGEMGEFLASLGLVSDARSIGRLMKAAGARYQQTRQGNFYLFSEKA